MKEIEIVQIALENLKKNAGITGKWKDTGPKKLDGQIELKFDEKVIRINTEIKKELRNHQLIRLSEQADQYDPFMVVAYRIFPTIKEELRDKQIAYLEANGNLYFKKKGCMIWLDAQKAVPGEREKLNRAFTKTGLKVILEFLLDEKLINKPYRDIAAQTEVGLGNINYILNGLKEMGFLISKNENEYILTNKKELLHKWMAVYAEKLKPALLTGIFRFLKVTDFTHWKKLPLQKGKTWWGGEAAGGLYTNYLRPGELTFYTLETRAELIKNYRLVPDKNGNVKAYKKFWHNQNDTSNAAPPLLVYADLMNTGDRRCIDTAQKIYDEFLQGKI